MNVAVRLQGGVLQTIDQRRIRIALGAFGIVAQQDVAHGLNRHLAGHIAGQCAAHAIGNDEHQALFAKRKLAHFLGRFIPIQPVPHPWRSQIEK